MIAEGIYTDLSSEEYHADKESISRSALMDFAKSPYTYWAKHLNPDRPKKDATPQMILGSAFHALILEPKLFGKQYAVLPEKVLLKNVGREIYDNYKRNSEKLEQSGRIILSSDEMSVLRAMEFKLLQSKEAVELIRDSRIENSFFWRDEHSGLLLKCRPDILHDKMIVDLKTCTDASPRAFQFEMVQYGYHIQGAMIRDGVERLEGRRINNVINICVETKYPHNMGIYIIDEEAIDAGEAKYKQICLDLKDVCEHNIFEDYGIQQIGLPTWYK